MNLEISKISLGLRHRRSFRIPEFTGSITDNVIRDDSSPFGKEFFIRTDAIFDNHGKSKGRILAGENEKDSIVVDIDNVVLSLQSSDIDETLRKIGKDYIPYLTKNIHKKFDINYFNRLGIVYEYNVTGNPDFLISRLTNDTFNNIQEGNIIFSSRETDMKSTIMKKLLDYKNYIITIGVTKNIFKVKFDYQYYFKPEIKSTGDIAFSDFIKESKNKLESKFLNWINNEKKE